MSEPSADPPVDTSGYAPSTADERTYSSVPLEDGEGERVVRQQAVGADAVEGSGEFPVEPRPPQEPAPGAAEEAGA